MDYAHPETSEVSAVGSLHFTTSLGRYPRSSSVRGQVLADLLDGKVLSALDAVYGSSTTRLAPVILVLKHYGWRIESIEQAVGTLDGRVAHVAFYFIRATDKSLALLAGAGEWIRTVRQARAAQRKHATQCKAKAAKWNKKRAVDPRQHDLWGAV